MTNNIKQQGPGYHELEESIHVLAEVEPTHSPMISCFLDMRQGAHEARRYLVKMRREIGMLLTGFERREFDQAYDNILNELQYGRYDCKGLVFFSRSYEGGHFFQLLKLDMAPENRVSVSDVPDFIPLMLLLHEHGYFLQVSVSSEAIELNEIGLGNTTLLGMAPLPTSSSEESRLAIAAHMLVRTMRSNPRRDVIIDGDLSFIHALYRTLPRLLRRRVIQLIPRTNRDSDHKISKVSKLTLKRHREHVSRNRLSEVVKSGEALEQLATGIPGCLHAMKSHSVSTLYLAADELDLRPGTVGFNGHEGTLLDVLRLAIQQSIPVEFTGGSKLMHQAGGIACLATETEKAVIHRSQIVPREVSLGMVA